MKVLRILGGLAAGTAAGLAVTAFNKDQSKTSQGEFDDSTRAIKQSTNNITGYVNQIKEETKQVKTIVDEVKTLISDFMKDIQPNINHIQENIEDIQKRGDVITATVQDITKSPSKKNIPPYTPKTQAIGRDEKETVYQNQSAAVQPKDKKVDTEAE
ncbi:hypothetical protein MUA90_05960 [Staphylococcus sp. IVB6181]|uniref:hypothetical protein n=1 Tax=unclassified Staphylococcus TaxID=91994 RepID=UPI000DF79CC8|nr:MULTISPECIES: hypothetical protein [unclassified Staphylococcus]UXV36008.1 hypothetical protein MUA90_05960 [Staphylococcus sp. IVB6181]